MSQYTQLCFAAGAGYFACFWPGKRPVLRIFWSIYLPAIAGLALICGYFLYLFGRPTSILEKPDSTGAILSRALTVLRQLGPGSQFCLFGLLLIGIFTSRIALGIAALPLGLSGRQNASGEDTGEWNRLQRVVWIFLTPVNFIATNLLLALVFLFLGKRDHLGWFFDLLHGASYAVIAVLAFGQSGLTALRHSLRLPKLRYFALAAIFSIGIGIFFPTAQYLFDRIQWALHEFGRSEVPQFVSYFSRPDAWLLLLSFSAFAEGFVFRGLLQPRFVQRYGISRGIFLIGCVWAAFHFYSDSSRQADGWHVVLNIFIRLALCLAHSYVFGWLSMRPGSILPSGVAQALYNFLVDSHMGHGFPGHGILTSVVWASLACVLFRYWPIPSIGVHEEVPQGATPEPAP